MQRDTLLALAERVELATGPDRLLDAEIAAAVDLKVPPDNYSTREFARTFGVKSLAVQGEYPRHGFWREHLPRYTASLDAAMALVPDLGKRQPQVEYMGPNPNNMRDGHRARLWIKNGEAVHGRHPTSARLALTAAALRAIANTGAEHD